MSKAVVKKGDTQVAATMEDWGVGAPEVSSKDVTISKLLPMQGMSKLVLDRKAQIGEYRDSVTGELLGSIDEPLEFVPVFCEKIWIVQKYVKGKPEYSHMEPITSENENRPWEEEIAGEKYRNVYTLMFYVLLPKDIKSGMPTPYTLTFKSTSVKAGKKLFTQMYVRNLRQEKVPPAAYVMELNGKITSNDFGTFVVMDVDKGRKASTDELSAALEVLQMVKSGTAKVDHSDVVTEKKGLNPDSVEF